MNVKKICGRFRDNLDAAERMCAEAVRLVCCFALDDARGDDETKKGLLGEIGKRGGRYADVYQSIMNEYGKGCDTVAAL